MPNTLRTGERSISAHVKSLFLPSSLPSLALTEHASHQILFSHCEPLSCTCNLEQNMLRQSFLRKVNYIFKSKTVCVIFPPYPSRAILVKRIHVNLTCPPPSHHKGTKLINGEGKFSLLGSFSCRKAG